MSDNSPSPDWHRQIAQAIPQHWFLKFVGTPLFIALFFGAYFYLLRNPAYSVTVVPFGWLDRWIEFQPLAVPLYVSLWVYVSLPPLLMATRSELFFYGAAIASTCLIGLFIFYFWPTAVPPAHIDWTRYPSVDFLKNLDAAGNALPSLHVATAFFSAVWLHRQLRAFGAPMWLPALSWTWCIGIIYSTLATRQHVALDVGGGLLLGGVTVYFALRTLKRSA